MRKLVQCMYQANLVNDLFQIAAITLKSLQHSFPSRPGVKTRGDSKIKEYREAFLNIHTEEEVLTDSKN